MMTRPILLLLFWALFLSASRSQTVTRISEEGILESLGLELKFNCPVINPEKGVQYATLEDIAPEYEHIREFLEVLAAWYGEFDLIKQLPDEMWGDTLKNRITDGALVSVIDMSQLYYLRFSDWIPVEEVLQQILELSEIEYAHPPAEAASLADQPNDPLYGDQWNLERILAEQAWGISRGSSRVTVAIIESQSLPYKLHPDLENKWDPNKGEQGTGDGDHGTRVAGIIGAETNNETGIASLGWNLTMSRYAFSYAEPPITLVNAIAAAVADTNRVINCSFVTISLVRWPPPNGPCHFRLFANYPSVQNAITNAISMGVAVVGGAGNSLSWHFLDGPLPYCFDFFGNVGHPGAAYPAAYNDVIAVSATGENDLWAEGQNLSDPLQVYNHGDWVDVAAPGMYVLTAAMPNGYSDADRGTSFSAPHVSALAGLILSVDSTLAVKDIITSTADKVDSVRFPYTNGRNPRLGYGRINAYKALSKANGPPAPPQNVQVTATPPNQYGYRYPKVTWSANSEPDIEGYELWRKVVAGMDCGNGTWYLLSGTIGPSTQEYTDFSIPTAGTGQCTAVYKLRAKDAANILSDYSNEVSVQFGNEMWKTRSGDSSVTLPSQFSLGQNFPNPFNPSTTIRYALPFDAHVSMRLIDILGREVLTLVDDVIKAGHHSINLDGNSLSSGIYFYQMKAGGFNAIKKLLLLR